MERRKRCIPAERHAVDLTGRDLLILDDVARCGYLDSTQIAREHFHSHDRALHRLRQLVDARLINATLISSRRPNLYSCSRSGLDALAAHGFSTAGLRLPQAVRSSSAAHLLLVNDIRLWCGAAGGILEWNGGRSRTARTAALAREGLVPDAIAIIDQGQQEVTVFVEADCGHETADLEDKLTRYGRIFPQNQCEIWLICVGDAARLRSIARMCVRARLGHWLRLAVQQDVTRRPAQALPLLAHAERRFGV